MSVASAIILTQPNERQTMYKVTSANDGFAPSWSKEFESEYEAWKSFFSFTDWGFSDEYRTVNLSTPTSKMYTKTFYRNGEVVVK
jgi:hypothetical protein